MTVVWHEDTCNSIVCLLQMSAPPMYLFLNHTKATPLAPVQERACPSQPSCTPSVAQGGILSIKLSIKLELLKQYAYDVQSWCMLTFLWMAFQNDFPNHTNRRFLWLWWTKRSNFCHYSSACRQYFQKPPDQIVHICKLYTATKMDLKLDKGGLLCSASKPSSESCFHAAISRSCHAHEAIRHVPRGLQPLNLDEWLTLNARESRARIPTALTTLRVRALYTLPLEVCGDRYWRKNGFHLCITCLLVSVLMQLGIAIKNCLMWTSWHRNVHDALNSEDVCA